MRNSFRAVLFFQDGIFILLLAIRTQEVHTPVQVYYPEIGGVRLEDVALVTASENDYRKWK
jgi:Xaa-Pro aminopeptidase